MIVGSAGLIELGARILNVNKIADLWSKNFGIVPPLGYQLREQFSDRWVRFHALPESKRYPETENEYSILLDRANTLASELFVTGDVCYLFSSRPDDTGNSIVDAPVPFARKSRDLEKVFSWTDPDDSEEEPIHWSTYSREISWTPKSNDDVLMKIADGDDYGVLWMSAMSSEVFAPYDGGFDLILRDRQRVRDIIAKYPDWLSSRHDML